MTVKTDTYGGLTFAFGYEYERLAYGLALSLKLHKIPLTVVVAANSKDRFEPLLKVANVVCLPGTYSKFAYESKAFELSPYDVTIKLDADMLAPADAHLHSYLASFSRLSLASGIAHSLSTRPVYSSPYRAIELALGLPVVYSASFVFRKTELAKEFYALVAYYFDSWFKLPFLSAKLAATTDTLYSLAWCKLDLPNPVVGLPFVHMKRGVAHPNLPSVSWTREVPFSLDDSMRLRVAANRVNMLFHYQDKHFLSESLLRRLEQCSL